MTFDPDWVISPGETLRDWLDENNISPRVGARTCAISRETFERLLDGDAPLSPMIAERLERGTQIPARLWLNLERSYREGLAAGKTDASRDA